MAPLGQLDATALAANAVVASDRYLPPYASYRHATFDGKAFAAFTAGGSAALPLFTTTHLIGASITSTVNLAFEFSVVKTFYVGQEKIIAVACYRSNAFPSGLDARSSFRVSTT